MKEMTLKKVLLAIGLIFLFFVGFSMAVIFGFGTLYKMNENANFERLREKSELNCETMALHCAVRDRDSEKVRSLALSGYDLNSVDQWDSTALVYAASWAPEMVGLLVELGVDLNRMNQNGDDALAVILRARDFSSAVTLIQKGANVNALVGPGPTRLTRLGEAIVSKDMELIRFFLSQNVDLSLQDGYGYDGCDRIRMYGLKEFMHRCPAVKKDPGDL